MGLTPAINSTHALADVGGGNPVFFDIPPNPEPVPEYTRGGENRRTLNATDGTHVLPGRTWFFDQGADITGATLIMHLEDVYPDTYQLILNKFLFGSATPGQPSVELVWYSPNNTNTLPTQNWNPTNIFELKWDGFPLLLPRGVGRYAGDLKFCINRLFTP